MAMAGFEPLDVVALLFFLMAAAGYQLVVESRRFGPRTLNALMDERRRMWLAQSARRDVRIVDAQILLGLLQGNAFFASTSLLAIGGAFALLQATDRILQVFADLPIGLSTSRTAWEIKVIGLAIIFSYAFFKFAWAYRLFSYLAILLGAMPHSSDMNSDRGTRAVAEAGAMAVSAGRHFNRGQRAFFFAIAYLGWFLGPLVFLATTAGVLAVMAHRQFASDSHDAIANPPKPH